jgi:hypothetical protein
VMWGWVGLEIINGIGHPVRSILAGGYTAGSVTAVALLATALRLARRLVRPDPANGAIAA